MVGIVVHPDGFPPQFGGDSIGHARCEHPIDLHSVWHQVSTLQSQQGPCSEFAAKKPAIHVIIRENELTLQQDCSSQVTLVDLNSLLIALTSSLAGGARAGAHLFGISQLHAIASAGSTQQAPVGAI